MIAVGDGAVIGVDHGDDFGEEDVAEFVVVEHSGGWSRAVGSGRACGRRGRWACGRAEAAAGEERAAAAIFHDNDHGFGFAFGEQVIHDEIYTTLGVPTGFVFACAVLEVEDGITLGGAVVAGRGVDEGAAGGGLNFRIVGVNAHGAVRHVLGLIVIAGRIGNVDAGHPLGAAKEALRAGIVDSSAVDIDVVIVEDEGQGRSRHGPVGVGAFGQGEALAGADDDGLRVWRVDAEGRLGFGVYFGILVARRIERRRVSVGRGLGGLGQSEAVDKKE